MFAVSDVLGVKAKGYGYMWGWEKFLRGWVGIVFDGTGARGSVWLVKRIVAKLATKMRGMKISY